MPCQSRQSSLRLSAVIRVGTPFRQRRLKFSSRKMADVALRASGQYLGSFARNWIIPLGFHPFQFGLAPQTPRLRCGRVIVQRRSWTVSSEEMGGGNFSGLSPELVLAVERLRAAKDLPRFVYIRPTEQALRRSGAEGRDKDTNRFLSISKVIFSWKFFIAG